MFGALNRFISRLDADPSSQRTAPKHAAGFQVLRNNNPELSIEPWFDFIIGINGRNIDSSDPSLFATEVRNLAGSSVNLGIWSAKGQRIRSLYVPIPAENPILGISLQWGLLSSTEDVWHILDITQNSPADMAGLLPYGDYVIGSPEGLVRGESGLGELVEAFLTHPLRLYVYNHEYNVTRLVTIHPSRTWGGTGALGCILGFGALHRIPASLDEPPQGPGETLFESARLSHDSERPTSSASLQRPSHMLAPPITTMTPPPPSHTPLFLVPPRDMPGSGAAPSSLLPATTPTSRPGPPPMHAGPRRPKPARAATSLLDMDAYFAEGEAKSRELEGGSTRSPRPPAGSSGLPPPPPPPPPPSTTKTGSTAGTDAAQAPPPPSAPPTTQEKTGKPPLAPPPKAGSLPKFGNVEWLGESTTGVMSVNPSPGLVPLGEALPSRSMEEGEQAGRRDGHAEGEDVEEVEHVSLPEPRVATPVVEKVVKMPWEEEEEEEEEEEGDDKGEENGARE